MTQHSQNKPEISIAPMMDWTDRHCRYFLRQISSNVLLYTEMVTTGAIIHGDFQRFLRFSPQENPIALQLGGSDPIDLAKCAKIGEDFGYNEINLNCGCPSDRVQSGSFGACLMKEPDQVSACIAAMIKAVRIPVTVKCRIGIDEMDDFTFLDNFVRKIADKGCKTFIIHARKAWLNGLSPKENREIPPLMYERVAEIKQKHPHLRIILNGGLKTVADIQNVLNLGVDGVMIGREAYQNPYFLADIEREIFQTPKIVSREEIARRMVSYIDHEFSKYGTPVKSVTRHMIGLYHDMPGARAWRRSLSTLPHEPAATSDVVVQALRSGGFAA